MWGIRVTARCGVGAVATGTALLDASRGVAAHDEVAVTVGDVTVVCLR